jgi:hypothetical protein
MRRELGILLTVGGVALIWLLKKYLGGGPTRHERFLTLESRLGRCGIREDFEGNVVELHKTRGDTVHWIIRNPSGSGDSCGENVRVCMGNWKKNGAPVESPLVDLQKGGLCTEVRRPQTATIHAGVREGASFGAYKYDVLVNGNIAADPMVRIVT